MKTGKINIAEMVDRLEKRVTCLNQANRNLIQYIEDNQKCGCFECRDELDKFLDFNRVTP